MLKAMIFDLDGTVGDTLPLCIAAFKKSIEPLTGATLSEKAIIDTFGPSEEGTVAKLVPHRYDEALAAYRHHYRDMHGQYPSPFEGLPEIFDHLKKKGVVLSIVTGKGLGTAVITFEQYGLAKYFTELETGSIHGSRKTAGIKSVLLKYGLSPDEAIYVGDAPSDVDYAREAGIRCYAAAWAGTADPAAILARQPDRMFTTIREFGEHVATLV